MTTAVFLKVGPRLLRIGLLALATSILVAVTAAALPVDLGFLAVALMVLASVVFLLSPAMLESQIAQRRQRKLALAGGDEPNSWTNDTT